MRRLLYLNAQPYSLIKTVADDGQLEVLTPKRAAARALGVSRRSLQDLAARLLLDQGMTLAHPLVAQRAFRDAIRRVLSSHDVEGSARTWMPTIQALLQASPSLEIHSPSERAQRLIQTAQIYQAILRHQNAVDPHEALWRASESQPKPQAVLIYGYFHPRPDELAFINAIAGDSSILVLPFAESAIFKDSQPKIDQLQQWGWQIHHSSTQVHTYGEQLAQQFLGSPCKVKVSPAYGYSSPEAEARGILTQVKQLLLNGVSARDVAIIARDEVAYGPKLLDIAWEYDIPLRALYATPLATTRLGAWIALLLEVIEQRFPFEATAKLLSHPLCSNPDAEFWSLLRNRRPKGFTAWEEVCRTVLGVDGAVLKLGNRARRETWAENLQTILKTFDLRRRCSRWARESLAFNVFSDALVNLSKPEAEVLSWSELAQEVRDILAIATVPAQPGRGGVELHSPASVMGGRYRYLYVMGMAEGVLPAPIQDDRVLDFYERKALHAQGIQLPFAAEAARQEALVFYHLLQTATEQVIFSYAKLNGRQEQLPSPYLKQLDITAIAPPPKPIASPEELRKIQIRQEASLQSQDAVLQHAVQAWQVELRRESDAQPDEYDGVIGTPVNYRDRIFSVSQLTQLGLCPFKWFADKGLKLGEPEADEDLSPSRRGNLYHTVLELLFKAAQAQPHRSVKDPDLLQQTFQEVEQAMNLTRLPVWSVRREEHLQILKRVIHQSDFYPDGAEAIALESRFQGTWQDLRITGRVDRIDRTDQGLVLIDYKTSSSAPKGVKNAEGKACIDLQLPIYQAVAAPALFPQDSVAKAYYYSLTKAEKLSKKLPDAADLAAVAEQFKDHFTHGHFPVQPDSDKVACQYCAFDLICRQGNRLSRKYRLEEPCDGTD